VLVGRIGKAGNLLGLWVFLLLLSKTNPNNYKLGNQFICMLNVLFNPKKAKRRPLEMMIVGFFYASLSLLLGAWIFPDNVSLVMVFFTVLSCLYVVQGTLKMEEEKEKDYKSEEWLLKQHCRVLWFLLCLFLGFVFAFSFWTVVLPKERVDIFFSLQKSVFYGIKAIVPTGNAVDHSMFYLIFVNNLKVLAISLIFAFFYGAGAIFVLAWNASVMGFVIGNVAENALGLISLPQSYLKYFLHGIPEMLAYLTISLAGGIIYMALIRGDFFREGRAKRLVLDTFILIFVSVILLVGAALIEMYISPYI
jgi:uncharacterized membrane protein SpoIIM required for sporulation